MKKDSSNILKRTHLSKFEKKKTDYRIKTLHPQSLIKSYTCQNEDVQTISYKCLETSLKYKRVLSFILHVSVNWAFNTHPV